MYTPLVLPHADMQRLYRIDYNTRDNMDSHAYTMPDVELERVLLDDKKRLQMVEKQVSSNAEVGEYKCHIASVKRYKTHEQNANNIVLVSWRFHQYFDGLVTKGIIPCLLVRLERTYKAASFHLGGRDIKRQRIDVIMDFTSEEGLQEVLSTLNEGTELLSPKQLLPYIYASDAELMCKFFELKHGETAELWEAKRIDVQELLTVEYNCSHQATP
jgi:hypothetical protein